MPWVIGKRTVFPQYLLITSIHAQPALSTSFSHFLSFGNFSKDFRGSSIEQRDLAKELRLREHSRQGDVSPGPLDCVALQFIRMEESLKVKCRLGVVGTSSRVCVAHEQDIWIMGKIVPFWRMLRVPVTLLAMSDLEAQHRKGEQECTEVPGNLLQESSRG